MTYESNPLRPIFVGHHSDSMQIVTEVHRETVGYELKPSFKAKLATVLT